MPFLPPKNKDLHDKVLKAISETRMCPRCNGSGLITPGGGFAINPGNRATEPCYRCDGTGKDRSREVNETR
jgi:DnaJ-class molecular chaperone